jgi:hypothetical protein
MYSNTNNAFTDVTLNTSETTKDKTAASKDYFQLFMELLLKSSCSVFFETQLSFPILV